ncbi:hypothetical protein M9H77_16491 [Catharanthus roseus]|uniref:Uncharacterized protein n=1 Tax=Catharanthus roseus TaxID=4058 RepID=A0ACC0B2A1_CATRO|nr:hypothetical protein M9H77_16491 [Catharanthus roseus]
MVPRLFKKIKDKLVKDNMSAAIHFPGSFTEAIAETLARKERKEARRAYLTLEKKIQPALSSGSSSKLRRAAATSIRCNQTATTQAAAEQQTVSSREGLEDASLSQIHGLRESGMLKSGVTREFQLSHLLGSFTEATAETLARKERKEARRAYLSLGKKIQPALSNGSSNKLRRVVVTSIHCNQTIATRAVAEQQIVNTAAAAAARRRLLEREEAEASTDEEEEESRGGNRSGVALIN